jgi:hypothetical protein
VIVGHAFISPKDIPFLSFFLLTLHFGLRLFDSLEPLQTKDLDPRSKRTFLALSALWLATVFGLFLFTDAFHTYITNLVASAKAGETNIVSYFATDLSKADAQVYIQRYFILFLRIRSLLFLLSSSALIFSIFRLLPRSAFRSLLSILIPAILLGFTASIRVLGYCILRISQARKTGDTTSQHLRHHRDHLHVSDMALFVAEPARAFC